MNPLDKVLGAPKFASLEIEALKAKEQQGIDIQPEVCDLFAFFLKRADNAPNVFRRVANLDYAKAVRKAFPEFESFIHAVELDHWNQKQA